MEIRELALTDENVSRLIAFSENWERENITWGLRANYADSFAGMRVFGAYDGGELMGYLTATPFLTDCPYAMAPDVGTPCWEIEELYVSPAQRSRGIGRALYEYAELAAKRDGAAVQEAMKLFDEFLQKWCALAYGARVVILTDAIQLPAADRIRAELTRPCEIILFDSVSAHREYLASLAPSDLVLTLFSFDTFMHTDARSVFSPFGKPEWLPAKHAFIRLSISFDSLAQGLSTEKSAVYGKIAQRSALVPGRLLRITNAAGTDITLKARPFTTCEHEIKYDGGHAFLPPSETWAEVVPGTANGKIAVDVTLGQLYLRADMLGYFGRVPSSVVVSVENGVVTDVTGNEMADALKAKWFALPPACRTMVELGQGLSHMRPTGLIGVDESIIHTCHFGFGDAGSCGVHYDMVIAAPEITYAD